MSRWRTTRAPQVSLRAMSPDHWLVRAAARRPDRVAVEAQGERLTYAELLERAREAAQAWERGRPAPLTEPAGLDFVVALHACLLAGAAAVPVDPRLGEVERAAVLASAALDDAAGSVGVGRTTRGEG